MATKDEMNVVDAILDQIDVEVPRQPHRGLAPPTSWSMPQQPCTSIVLASAGPPSRQDVDEDGWPRLPRFDMSVVDSSDEGEPPIEAPYAPRPGTPLKGGVRLCFLETPAAAAKKARRARRQKKAEKLAKKLRSAAAAQPEPRRRLLSKQPSSAWSPSVARLAPAEAGLDDSQELDDMRAALGVGPATAQQKGIARECRQARETAKAAQDAAKQEAQAAKAEAKAEKVEARAAAKEAKVAAAKEAKVAAKAAKVAERVAGKEAASKRKVIWESNQTQCISCAIQLYHSMYTIISRVS